jgi:antitoxin ParD1/3/4
VLSTSSLELSEESWMKPAGQMTLTLTPELENFVREEARRGAFASSSEYVRDMLRARYREETDRAAKLKALDEALARGVADANAGRVIPLELAFNRLREELGLSKQSTVE